MMNPTVSLRKFFFDLIKPYKGYVSAIFLSCHAIEKLNMDLQYNRDKLYEYAKNSNIFGKLSMQENADLVMFYAISFLKEHIYYIKSLDAIVVAIEHDEKLHLWDIFSKNDLALDSILDSFTNINEIVLGFTPKDCHSYHTREFLGEDTLFIQHGKASLFNDNKIMFPLLSHA